MVRETLDTFNTILIRSLAAVLFAAFSYRLWQSGLDIPNCHGFIRPLHVLCYDAVAATFFTYVLRSAYLDEVPFKISYRVMGRQEIPVVEYELKHGTRWSTFTVWCNTVAMAYFSVATVVGALQQSGNCNFILERLYPVLAILWEITLPMGYLVNLVVTFVLIPGMKKQGQFDKLRWILRWRPQALHNGYVLLVAIEAIVATPCMSLQHFTVVPLYGLTYVVFSWVLFARTGVFIYFFMDPRFKFAPLALIFLLALLTLLYCVLYFAVQAASESWFVKCFIFVFALGTCTFRDDAAIAPANRQR